MSSAITSDEDFGTAGTVEMETVESISSEGIKKDNNSEHGTALSEDDQLVVDMGYTPKLYR